MKTGKLTTKYKFLQAPHNEKQYWTVRQETMTDCFQVDFLPWNGDCHLHVNREPEFWSFPSMPGPMAVRLPAWFTMA